MRNTIIIGTRGSKLALWQAEWVKSELKKLYPDLNIELNKIKTTGDKILDVPLANVGGKGLFVKEIEEALLGNKADIAVHSMKDVPTNFPEGLHLAVICEREDPRDAFIVRTQNTEHRTQTTEYRQQAIKSFKDLPQGATVGTSSLRRICQILNKRSDLKIAQLRGNVDSRIRKLDEGQFDAIILAAAGMKRLGWGERITEVLSTEISLPAVGQGAIGIECRIDDKSINNLIKPLNHSKTSICVRAERAFLKKLEGGCQVPMAAYARLEHRAQNTEPRAKSPEHGQKEVCDLGSGPWALKIDGLVGSVSGNVIINGYIEGNPDNAESIGIKLAEDLLSKGAAEILYEVYELSEHRIQGTDEKEVRSKKE